MRRIATWKPMRWKYASPRHVVSTNCVRRKRKASGWLRGESTGAGHQLMGCEITRQMPGHVSVQIEPKLRNCRILRRFNLGKLPRFRPKLGRKTRRLQFANSNANAESALASFSPARGVAVSERKFCVHYSPLAPDAVITAGEQNQALPHERPRVVISRRARVEQP